MLFLSGTSVILLIAASVADLRWRRIPNILVLAVAAIALIRIALNFDLVAAGYDFAAALAVFAALIAAWRLNLLGAGDVKLLAATALLVGHQAVPNFLVATTLFGGFLALLALADARMAKSFGRSIGLGIPIGTIDGGDVATMQPSVPYGIAISAACAMTLFLFPTMR
jgi:prepilin peptidase CpaA